MLSDVPDFLQLQIFKKMKPRPFVNTYRTTKWVKNLLDSNAGSIAISTLTPLKLTIQLATRSRGRIVASMLVGQEHYPLRIPHLPKDFERKFNKMRLYFFNFEEVHLSDQQDDGTDQTATADGILSCLRILKFKKLSTSNKCHLSMFREVLRSKKTKLYWHGNHIPENDEDLKFLNEIHYGCSIPRAACYMLDTIAKHVPNLTLMCNNHDFDAVFPAFVRLVERTVQTGRKEISVSLEKMGFGINCRYSASRFPTPASQHVLGPSIVLIYANKADKNTYFYMNLCELRGSSHIQFSVVPKSIEFV